MIISHLEKKFSLYIICSSQCYLVYLMKANALRYEILSSRYSNIKQVVMPHILRFSYRLKTNTIQKKSSNILNLVFRARPIDRQCPVTKNQGIGTLHVNITIQQLHSIFEVANSHGNAFPTASANTAEKALTLYEQVLNIRNNKRKKMYLHFSKFSPEIKS